MALRPCNRGVTEQHEVINVRANRHRASTDVSAKSGDYNLVTGSRWASGCITRIRPLNVGDEILGLYGMNGALLDENKRKRRFVQEEEKALKSQLVV